MKFPLQHPLQTNFPLQGPPHMKLPPQSPPVARDLLTSHSYLKNAGVVAARTPCDSLSGLAQQMCYSALYHLET
jgi:hypothetical protein